MGEKPVSKWPSLLVQVFCLGDEIQLRDIYSRGAGHVAEMTADAKVNPFIHGGLAGPSKSLSTGARLFRPWELWGHPRNRADGHTGGAANANIGIIPGPISFL